MKLAHSLILLCTALAACGQPMPESNPDFSSVDIGRGVGFGDYASYEAARLAQERGQAPVTAAQPVPVAPLNTTPPVISSEELRSAGLPVSEPVQTAALPQSGPIAAAPAPVAPNNTGISDEQSFAAVSARETIESDAERLARNREQYQVVQPRAVPQSNGQSGPNIVQFALSTTNLVGQPVYRRGGLFQDRRFQAACAQYASPDLAQVAFLAAGGPERDKLGVDPDGDGFACAWDPAPFRAVRR